ncbi:MAG: amino acid ABC transporter ATP-binding protein [Caulobacteraceae bacterium]
MTDLAAAPVPAIEFRAAGKRFGAARVLDGVDLAIQPGEVVVVCGPSGSGKSTLIRLINGLEACTEGEVRVQGQPVSGLKGRALQALRARIGFVFQQFNLYGHLTARRNITLGLRAVQKLSAAEADARASEVLARVGLAEKDGAYPAELSGGQQQRVAIARALAARPRILLFDEPTSALDPEMIGEVLSVIRELAHSGITLVIVTHEMGFAREVADRIVFIDGGQILEDAPPSRFFSAPGHPRAQRFLRQLLSPLHRADP